MHRSFTARSRPALLLAFGVVVALAAIGCGGGSEASPSPSPTPIASSLTEKLQEFKGYADQVQPIYQEASAAVTSVAGAVSDLSARPDQTWTDSSAELETAAATLGTAATDLEALTPPASLQAIQDNVVAALRSAQKVVYSTSSYLAKGVYTPDFDDIKSQIEEKVNSALAAAWGSILEAAGGSSPAP